MNISDLGNHFFIASFLDWVGLAGFLLALVIGVAGSFRYFRGFDVYITGVEKISSGEDGVVLIAVVAVVNKSSRTKPVPGITVGVNSSLTIDADLPYEFKVSNRVLSYKIPYLAGSLDIPEDLYGRTPAVIEGNSVKVFSTVAHITRQSGTEIAGASIRAIVRDWHHKSLSISKPYDLTSEHLAWATTESE